MNVALSTNGGVASASSTFSGFGAPEINDGERDDQWASAEYTFPQWCQVDFAGQRKCSQVGLYWSIGFGFAMRDFTVQWWDGDGWQVAETVVDNEDASRTFSVDFVTDKVRIVCTAANGGGDYSRLAELEVEGDVPLTGLPEGWVRVSDNWACKASELTEARR